MIFEYDARVDALDITLSDGVVTRTLQLDPGTLIDLDAAGTLVSIEVIHPARDWPLADITEGYQLDPEDVAVLESLWGGSEGRPYPFTRERELAPA